jgi:gluconokinase
MTTLSPHPTEAYGTEPGDPAQATTRGPRRSHRPSRPDRTRRMTTKTAVVVMGVAGSGKSTIAELLARQLGWTTTEADDLHSPASVAKMAAGVPLDDDDREPWLHRICQRIEEVDGNQVLTCSALKRRYRDILRTTEARVRLLHLDGAQDLIGARIGARTGHFMPPDLLDSQFATLESLGADEDGVSIPIDGDPATIVERAITALRLRP